MEVMETLVDAMLHNAIFRLVVVAVVMDTILGAGRAIKQHSFNSSVGIDGAIRKISMLVSIMFLGLVDYLVKINLIGFIPKEVRTFFPAGLNTIGLAEFFGILYLAYEIVSILKNMTLCGLPVRKVWEVVREFLGKYTEELPDTEQQDAEEPRQVTAVATDNVPEDALEANQGGTVKVYDNEGNAMGYITKEKAEELAAQVTEVKVE